MQVLTGCQEKRCIVRALPLSLKTCLRTPFLCGAGGVRCPFFTVRDGLLQEARKVLRNLDMGALIDNLKQTIPFFAAARKSPGSSFV